VAVVEPDDQLLEEPPRLVLLEAVLAHDVLEHVAARRELHRDCEVVRRQEHLLKLHDVRVHEVAVVEDLALHVLGHLGLLVGVGVWVVMGEGARVCVVWRVCKAAPPDMVVTRCCSNKRTRCFFARKPRALPRPSCPCRRRMGITRTLSPRSMNLMAISSPVLLSRAS
jgi:hypothetical protein